MRWRFPWFDDLGIARRMILLFLLFVTSMAVVALHLRQLAEEERADIAALQMAVEQKQQLIALQTAVSTYSTLLDSRQSLIASRNFGGLRALKNAIETSRAESDERLQSFADVYPDADVDAIGQAIDAMSEAQAAYLRDVVAGDVIAAARRQETISATRERVDEAIAENASEGVTEFETIRGDLATMAGDLSFAIGIAITIMVIASALFLVMILFSVSRPLGRLFQAIDGLDEADSAAFPRDTGPPEFRAIGRALEALARRVRAQRAAEEQLRQAQARDAVSRLSGGVAHDFNNLLTVLQSNLELLQKRAELKAPLRDMLARCIRATERGSRLTARLLTLGQRQSLHPEPMDVAAFLDEFGELVRRTLPSSIQVTIDTEEDLPPIHVDQAMLQDALLNLVVNARDAMPSGGTLGISAKRVDETSPCPEAVAFEIADSGDGMPADIVEKVFEPFFTTKGVGKGSGLGLSMVRGFVEQSGGTITLESAPDQGTTITLILPMACSDDAERLEPVETSPARQRGQGETILLVEDDDDVRSSMESILIYLGYTVRSAPNADDAFRVLNESRTPIALVISDVVMPGDLHGDDLAVVIGERYAGLPVVLMSGYAEQGIRQDVLDRDIPLLTKPVATETLQQVLHEQLRSSHRTNEDSSDAHFDS